MYALMLPSGNDAAWMLALHMGNHVLELIKESRKATKRGGKLKDKVKYVTDPVDYLC